MPTNLKHFNLSSSSGLDYRASDGRLLKWWIGGEMVKTSTLSPLTNYTSFMYESISEVIVYRLFTELGILNTLRYDLCHITLDNLDCIGCYSTNFLAHKGEQYIDIGKLVMGGLVVGQAYKDLVTSLTPYIPTFRPYIDETLILDALIINTDRHLGNIGIIYDTQANTYRLPPIFDNGDSLFGGKQVDDLEYSPDLLRYVNARPFHPIFATQLMLVSNPLKIVNKGIPKTLQYIDSLAPGIISPTRARFISTLLIDRISTLHNQGYLVT